MIVRPNFDQTLLIKSRCGCKVLAVLADGDIKDSPSHRFHLLHQIGVITDHTSGLTKDSINFGSSIGTSDKNFVPSWMASQSLNTTT